MNATELQQVAKFLKKISDKAMVPNLEELQLTKAEGIILSVLMRADSMSITDLVQQTLLPQSQVSMTITSLVKREWIVAMPDTNDHRKTIACVVPRIRLAAEQSFLREVDTFLDTSLPELSAGDATKLKELLKRIADIIRARGEEA